MGAKVFLQLFRYDVSAIGDEQVRTHLFLTFFVHTRDGHIEILDRQGRNGAVAQMLGEPSKILREWLDELLVELVDEIHLSHHYHAFVAFVQFLYQIFVVAVVYIQSLVAGDDTHFG